MPAVGPASTGFSGRAGLILATIGSAVGLGSIWKFPYEVGENGGGAFVLVYAVGLLLVVAPLMLAELAIGRRGRSDAPGSLRRLAAEAGASPFWAGAGWLMVAGGLVIMAYYAVFGGLTAAYAAQAALSGFGGLDAPGTRGLFATLTGDAAALLAWHAAFLAVCSGVVARGVAGGIEAACRILMPLLVVLMALLALHGALAGAFAESLSFLFAPRLEALSARTLLEALGLGFFSIGVGLGVFMTYAGEAPRKTPLGLVAAATILGDTAISLLAGLAVFPLVFAHGLDPAEGMSLMFLTLPIAFGRIPFGDLVGLGFFLALAVAALTSAISMMELALAPLLRRTGWSRPRAALAVGGACWLAGIPAALSFGPWEGLRPLALLPGFGEAGIVEVLDRLASNLVLPLAGLLLALFAAHVLPPGMLQAELGWGERAVRALRRLLGVVVPVLVAGFVGLGHLLP